MGKQLKNIRVYIDVSFDDEEGVSVSEHADITVGIEEYPEMPVMRKGITIELSDVDEKEPLKHCNKVIIPQAEMKK